jgi:sugar/nucleoside kinase (ribokinase family)
MYQLIAIGDITIDLYFQGSSITQDAQRFNLAVGGKYYADAFYHGLGGSAANVSIHAAQMGLDSAAVSRVGENAFKNIIVQSLARKSVSTEFLHFDREHFSISSILLSSSGERTVVKYSDPKDHIDVGEHAMERIKRSGIVFMGNLPYVSVSERTKFMKGARSDSNTLALNFGSKECEQGAARIKGLIDTVDILFLNKYEFADLVGEKAESLKLGENQLLKLKSNLPLLVVTDGQNGSHAYGPGGVFHEAAVKVTKVIDTTGAGDAFAAAFLVKYAETKDVQSSLSAGADHAAKIVTKIGAN